MLRLYNTLLAPARLAAGLWGAWVGRDPARRIESAERRAVRLPSLAPGGLWIHGSSLGEARIVGAVARAVRRVRPQLPLALSATTPTGRAQLPGAPDADAAFFLPFDFPDPVSRVIDAVRPATLAVIETELWPNLFHACFRRGVPVVILNGRLAPRRMQRYRRLAGLYAPLLEGLAVLGAQSEGDAERFLQLGARPGSVVVTGNVKYDLPPPAEDPTAVRDRLGIDPGRPVVVAGSTAPDEEPAVLEAFLAARRSHPTLLLVLAPRHVTRADDVARRVAEAGLGLIRHSASRRCDAAVDVLLVDTVGDLPGLYPIAQAAFVGGSLVPVGGHNVLEPAGAGVPVLFGPHTEHFREPAERLVRSGGGFRVADAAGLGLALGRLLADAALREGSARKAAEVIEVHRGALDRSLALLRTVLEEPRPRPAAEGR